MGETCGRPLCGHARFLHQDWAGGRCSAHGPCACEQFVFPTPAPTAPLTGASEALLAEIGGIHERLLKWSYSVRPEDKIEWADIVGDSFDKAVKRALPDIERDAIARHREQADAEASRLRAAIPADPWLMWNDGGNGDAFYQCYRCYSDESQGHAPSCAWLATRPSTPSPEQGA